MWHFWRCPPFSRSQEIEEKLSHEVLSLKMELSKVRQTATVILWSWSIRKIYFHVFVCFQQCDKLQDNFNVVLSLQEQLARMQQVGWTLLKYFFFPLISLSVIDQPYSGIRIRGINSWLKWYKLATRLVQEICQKTLRILIPECDQWNALLLTGIPIV